MRKIFAVLISWFILGNIAFAETIYLKSGQKIDGKILEKTEKSIKVDIGGVVLTYFDEDIEKIEGARPSSDAAGPEPALSGPYDTKYINEAYGFEIQAPKGWFKHPSGTGQYAAVLFTKRAERAISYPILGVTIDKAPAEINTALAFANLVLPSYQIQGSTFRLIEAPHEVEINGLKGARFIFEMRDPAKGRSMTSIDYKFMQGNLAVSLQGADYPETFQASLKEIETIVNSFRFVGASDDFKKLENIVQIPVVFNPVEENSWDLLKQQIADNMQTKNTFRSLLLVKDKTEPRLSTNDFKRMDWLMKFISPQNFEITQSDYYNNVGDVWRVVGDKIYIQIGVWMEMPTEAPPNADLKSQEGMRGMAKARKEIYQKLSFNKYLELLQKEKPVGIAQDKAKAYTIVKFNPPEAKELFIATPPESSITAEAMVWFSNKDKVISYVKILVGGQDKDGKEIKQEYEHYFMDYGRTFELGKPDMSWMQEKRQ